MHKLRAALSPGFPFITVLSAGILASAASFAAPLRCEQIVELKPGAPRPAASEESVAEADFTARAQTAGFEIVEHQLTAAATASKPGWMGEGPLVIRELSSGRTCELDGDGLTRIYHLSPSPLLLVELGAAHRPERGSDAYIADMRNCARRWKQGDHTPSQGRITLAGRNRFRVEDFGIDCERPGRPTERCGTILGVLVQLGPDCSIRTLRRPSPKSAGRTRPGARRSPR